MGVSFFAFQDVITAVTGIVLVLVLLLAVELVQQPASAEPEVSAELLAEHARLKTQVEAAQEEWSRLEARLGYWDQLLQNADTTSVSGLQRRLDAEKRQLLALEEQLEQIRGESVQQSALLADKLRHCDKERRRLEQETADIQSKLRSVQQKLAETQQRLQEIQNSDYVFYQMPRGDNRSGWIGVISKGQVRIAPIGRPSVPQTLTEAGFLRFCRTAGSRGRLYVFLLVRPDGVATFDKLQGALDSMDIAYGYDVIGQNVQVLHPRYGAAPP